MKFKNVLKEMQENQDLQEASSITRGSDANADYNKIIGEINDLMKTLQKQVKEHQKKQKSSSKNWGNTGDLEGVKKGLQDAVDTMK